jgi:hypothetical protein
MGCRIKDHIRIALTHFPFHRALFDVLRFISQGELELGETIAFIWPQRLICRRKVSFDCLFDCACMHAQTRKHLTFVDDGICLGFLKATQHRLQR